MRNQKNQLTRADWVLEIIGCLGIILIVGVIASSYTDLPETISSHFNCAGKPDATNNKVQYVNTISSNISTTSGNIVFSTTTGTTGNE